MKNLFFDFMEVLKETSSRLQFYAAVSILLPILGSSVCYYYGFEWTICFVLSGLFIWYNKIKNWIVGILLFLIFLGYLYYAYPKIKTLPTDHQIIATISQIPKPLYKSRGFRLFAYWKSSQTQKKEIILIRFYNPNKSNLKLTLGQTIEVVGSFRHSRKHQNLGGFDEHKYLKSLNVSFVFDANQLTIKSPPHFILNWVAKVRSYLILSYQNHTHPKATNFILAVILGIRDDLNVEYQDVFKQTGMYHLLAISGLHIGVISLILLSLLAILRIPRMIRFLLVGLFLWLFVAIVGFPISVIRAVLIYTLILPYIIFQKKKNGLYILTLSCLILLIFQPYQVMGLGFQLTFLATFFLIYYGSFVLKLTHFFITTRTFISWMISSMSLSMMLCILLSPFLLPITHQITPISVIGNIIAAAIMPILIVSIVLTPIVDFFSFSLADYLGQSASFIFFILYFLLKNLMKVPYAYFYHTTMEFFISFWIIASFLFFPIFYVQKKLKLFLVLLFFSLGCIFLYLNVRDYFLESIEIHFLDVGQGDAIVIQLPNNFDIIIDGGKGKTWSGRPSMGDRVLIPFLTHQKIKDIDLMVVSHPDYDHYGGLISILEKWKVKKLLYPDQISSSAKSWQHFLKIQKEKEIPNIDFQCGDTLFQGKNFLLQIESPCDDISYTSKNEESVVLRLIAYDQCFLLTGDIESQAENVLVERGIKSCNILKVPHHGSRSSSNINFLKLIQPQIAIVSAGKRNRYRHPHKDVIDRYKKYGIKIYSTVKTGMISFYLNSFGRRVEE